MQSTIFGSLLALCCVLGCAAGGRTLGNRDTKSYVIVQISPVSPIQSLAHAELIAYLRRMNPTHFGIRTDSGSIQQARIVLCLQNSSMAEEIKPPLARLGPEGFALAVRRSSIYLVGGDDRGLLYAVYEFLELLGCRWLAPAFEFYKGDHEYVPELKEVEFALSEDLVCTPALKYRKLDIGEGISHNLSNLRPLIAWMPKLRFNTLMIPTDYRRRGEVRWDNWRETLTPELQKRGIAIEVGGHGYHNFLNAEAQGGRLFSEHPQWFGMDETGKRTREPGRILCSSNTDAVACLQDRVIAYLKERPEIEIFDFWPPDGETWCTCTHCKALGTPPQRHARLVSQMASALSKQLPKVRLECIAYLTYLQPPPDVTFDKSVMVEFCPASQNFENQINDPNNSRNKRYARALQSWLKTFAGEVVIYSYYRKYAWRSLPNLIPHYMQRDIAYYRDSGVKGLSCYCEPADWFTYELNHYVLGHLVWNPDVDVDALIDDFCSRRYGPEARTAREIFTNLEAVVRRGCTIPFVKRKTLAEYQTFADRIDYCVRKVSSARKRRLENKVLSDHLSRLALMLEYAKRDLALQQHIAANGQLSERQKMVDDLRRFHKKHADAGVFLWHHRLQEERQYREYHITKLDSD
ncbi:MAG: DUF4838 domain-containing protein [Planctomycetota bacterium]